MSDLTMKRRWPDLRAVWRWHFYAGLFCIPFVFFLAATGGIYLFKPQVEAWLDRDLDTLVVSGAPATAAAQVQAALAAVPGATLNAYVLPTSPQAAVRVLVEQGGERTRVSVHPQSTAVLKVVAEEDRFMRLIFRLHGELMLGNGGSYVVELAASWAIVMILTGLVLWWPRNAQGLGGVLYPRLGSQSQRLFWRDLHGVVGFWVSAFALLLLLSGLPWAKFWGDNLKALRQLNTPTVVVQDWTTGRTKPAPTGGGEHAMHGAHASHAVLPPYDLAALDRLVATVQPLQLAPPVLIAPPNAKSAQWTARSDTANRPQRVNLVLDGATGAITERKDFSQRLLLDRIIGTGVALHEGQLFGWLNQLLGLFTALGLMLVCASAVVLWLRRRPSGRLGAPEAQLPARFAPALLVTVIALGLLLPMMGLSLIAVLLIERLLLRRLPAAQQFLGLPAI